MAKRGRPKGSGTKTQKETTKPWEGGQNPWAKDVFRLPHKHKGFHPCFVNKTAVSDYLYKGYVYAKPEDYGIIKSEESEKGLSAEKIYRRELVLLELPNSQKKLLDDAQRGYTDQQTQAALKSESGKVSRESQGGITTELDTTIS